MSKKGLKSLLESTESTKLTRYDETFNTTKRQNSRLGHFSPGSHHSKKSDSRPSQLIDISHLETKTELKQKETSVLLNSGNSNNSNLICLGGFTTVSKSSTKNEAAQSSEKAMGRAEFCCTNSNELLGPRKPTASVMKLKAIASTDDSTILQDQSIVLLHDESF